MFLLDLTFRLFSTSPCSQPKGSVLRPMEPSKQTGHLPLVLQIHIKCPKEKRNVATLFRTAVITGEHQHRPPPPQRFSPQRLNLNLSLLRTATHYPTRPRSSPCSSSSCSKHEQSCNGTLWAHQTFSTDLCSRGPSVSSAMLTGREGRTFVLTCGGWRWSLTPWFGVKWSLEHCERQRLDRSSCVAVWW